MVVRRIADDVEQTVVELLAELFEPAPVGVEHHEGNPHGAELGRDMPPRCANAADNDVLIQFVDRSLHTPTPQNPLQITFYDQSSETRNEI